MPKPNQKQALINRARIAENKAVNLSLDLAQSTRTLAATTESLRQMNQRFDEQQAEITHLRALLIGVKVLVRSVESTRHG